MSFNLIYTFKTENNIILSQYNDSFTGLTHIHVENPQGQEHAMLLGVVTQPDKDHGVAHILEHLTLAGSKKYPKGDPFMGMINRSAASFLNALTYSANTRYPVASPIEKDFFNLSKVYCDAVWNPVLSKENFQREGWRIEIDPQDLQNKPWLENKAPKAAITGIVYNEMKGVESDPGYWKNSQEAKVLFVKGSPEYVNSGGDPCVIPDLSLEELTEFHKTHYHPSQTLLITISPSIKAQKIQNFLKTEFLNEVQPLAHKPDLHKISQSHPDSDTLAKGQDVAYHINIPLQGDLGYSLTAAVHLGYKKISKTERYFLNLLSFIIADHSSPVIENCMLKEYGDPSGYCLSNADNHWFILSFENRKPSQIKEIKKDVKKWVRQRVAQAPLDLINAYLDKKESDILLKGFAQGYFSKSPATAMVMEIFENVVEDYDYFSNIDQLAFLKEVRQAVNDPDRKIWSQMVQAFDNGWLFIEGNPVENYMENVSARYKDTQAKRLAEIPIEKWASIAQDQQKFEELQIENEKMHESYLDILPKLELEDFSKISPKLVPKIMVKPGWLHFSTPNQGSHRILLVNSLAGIKLSSYEIWLLEQSLDLRQRLGLELDGKIQSMTERQVWNKSAYCSASWSREFTENLQGLPIGWFQFSSVMTDKQIKDWPAWWKAIESPQWEQIEPLKSLIESQLLAFDQMSAEDCLLAAPSMIKSQNGDWIAQQELKAFADNKNWMLRWKHLANTAEGLSIIYKEIEMLWNKLKDCPQMLISIGDLEAIRESGEQWWSKFEIKKTFEELLPLGLDSSLKVPFKYIAHNGEGNYNYLSFDFKSKEFLQIATMHVVCQWISQQLVKKIREQGGAYGASAKIESSEIVLRSFRDPRFEDTFNDMLEVCEKAKQRQWTSQDILQGALGIFRAYCPVRTPQEWAIKAALQLLCGYPSNHNEQMLKAASLITPEMCAKAAQEIFTTPKGSASILSQDFFIPLEDKEKSQTLMELS